MTNLNRLEKYFLRRIAAKVVVQGGHRERITSYYRILAEAANAEFTEENKVTTDTYLRECQAVAQMMDPKDQRTSLKDYSSREILSEAIKRLDPIDQARIRNLLAAYLRGD